MKRTQAALLLTFILISLCTNAQDELLKKKGNSYSVNILYKNERIVKYQKYQERDKRIFTVPLGYIYAIKYASGQIMKPDGSPMSEELFAYQKIALFNQQRMKRGIASTSIASFFVGGGLGLISWGIYDVTNVSYHGRYVPILGIMAIIGGTGLTGGFLPSVIIGSKKIKRAKANLRQAGPKPVTMNFNPIMIPAMNQSGGMNDFAAGAGLSIHF